MIHARVTWNGAQAQQQLDEVLVENLTRAVVFLWTEIQTVLNVPNTGVRRKGRGRTPSGRRRTRTVYPHPSKPGEPPRKRTGWLQRNVLYSIDAREMSGRVGIQQNARYGLYLEMGTRKMEARPWLVATVERVKDDLARLLFGGP